MDGLDGLDGLDVEVEETERFCSGPTTPLFFCFLLHNITLFCLHIFVS